MKKLLVLSLIFHIVSCSAGQKLIERKADDGSTITVKKEKFGGVDYLYAEKYMGKKKLLKLYYGCECGFDNLILLKKNTFDDNGKVIIWEAVTDTVNQIKFFDRTITSPRLFQPTTFIPITTEKSNILEEALSKLNLTYCSNPNKPINKIIGYVKANQ